MSNKINTIKLHCIRERWGGGGGGALPPPSRNEGYFGSKFLGHNASASETPAKDEEEQKSLITGQGKNLQ